MRFSPLVLGVAVLATCTLFATPSSAQEPTVAGVECRDLPALFRVFTQQHYSIKRIDETVQGHTVDRFIEIIDPSKTFLLAPEVAKLKTDLPQVFERSRQGDCSLLEKAWGLVEKRAAQDQKIVSDFLTPNFKVDDNTELVLDPDKRNYAKDEAARVQHVKNMIQFQMSNYLTAGITMDQAKKQLTHRYELVQRRIDSRSQKGAIPGLWAQAFAEALDPHTAYMPPDELADFEIALKLSLEGIGAVLTTDDGFTVIQSLVPGGQADKTGQLRPKDKIIGVAQEGEAPVSTIDMDLTDVVKMIRGKKGSKVTITVLREGKATKTFTVSIVRDKIDVSSQAAKITYDTRKLGNRSYKVGVIDLPSFYGGDKAGRSSYEDMKKLLREARDQKVDGIVLDLSRNGGGLLDDAVRISGLFIRKGAVVGTKSTDSKLSVLDDTDARVEWDGPLAVVISRASASASEILAGALKDYKRALIVGSEKTFGKGTVQVVVPMPESIGAIRVTTGMFFLPGGDSTQLKGVTSDIQIPSVFDGFDVGEDKLQYALPAQSVPQFTSPQANGSGPDDHWDPVPANMVPVLAEKSRQRVATDPAFAKIKEQLANLAKNKGAVRLGDLRKRTEKEKAEEKAQVKSQSTAPAANVGDAAAPEDEERADSLQKTVVKEGVNILVDAMSAGLGSEVAQHQSRRTGTD